MSPFYRSVLGFEHEGDDNSFSTMRVTPNFVILITPYGTKGGEHLAFAMSEEEFAVAFQRIIAQISPTAIASTPSDMRGPGDDPDKHLIEIRYYET